MNPLTMLWTDIRVLLVQTTRLWWRLLPQLLAIHLLGWLSYQVSLRLAAFAIDFNSWVALVIFSTGFIGELAAVVLSLRLCGRELGIRELLPADEAETDDREASFSRMLAVTLLPFLALYAAFGYMQEAAVQLSVESYVRQGLIGTTNIIATLAMPGTRGQLILASIIVGSYLIRRGLDFLHERTGWRWVGILVAIAEAFFILMIVLAGQRVIRFVKSWFMDRAFVGWFAAIRDRLAEFFSIFRIDLPAVLVAVGDFFRENVWPSLWNVVSEPIVWLAVAALIFGSRVSSLAELWRKGKPMVDRLGVASRIEQRRINIEASAGVRKLALEARSMFLGDLDDKYLPTIHSVRLVLRAGVIFLGAFILVYGLQEIMENYLRNAVRLLTGGHLVAFWTTTSPIWNLIYTLPIQPWRLCLLAVAFYRCLQLLRARALSSDAAEELLDTDELHMAEPLEQGA